MNNEALTLLPFLHGKVSFARQLRSLLLKTRFDCIAIDIPECFQSELIPAVENMPVISIVYAQSTTEPIYYIPTDPCDVAIEGFRQGLQNNIPVFCVGSNDLKKPVPVGPLPDDFAAEIVGFNRFNTMCLLSVGNPEANSLQHIESQILAHNLLTLKTKYKRILALIHYRHYASTVSHLDKEKTCNTQFDIKNSYTVHTKLINPDHLYFVLGELPFITGKYEKERYNLFSDPFDIFETVKDLFRETRDDYYDDDQTESQSLSPSRIQTALTFLRNLTVMSGNLLPSLPDIIDAAKGVGGNAFAIRILKSAKYYPYVSFDTDQVKVGIERILIPGIDSPLEAINLFRDTDLQWRTISIKPDPSLLQKKKYKFAWNPFGMCSHTPEDTRIERFNTYIRKKTLKLLVEDYVKNEKFSTSVKDGIDIRETLRNWNTGSIYVKEIPPSRGNVDSVVIIFENNHDEKYPHCATWYAEHQEESTLSFFATSPLEHMVGPGIAKCYYGGLSLLFPPRHIPDIFQLTESMELPNLTSRLTYGAMLFSKEKVIPFISVQKPGTYLKSLSAKLKKHLLWIPINTFSNETITKIRRFHILNGKIIRNWAARFIED